MDWAILLSHILILFLLLPFLFASMLLNVMANLLRWPVKYTMNDMFAAQDKRQGRHGHKINELERIAKKIERRKTK